MSKTKPITVRGLGKLLYEEFERGHWGDIIPYYFQDPPLKNGDNPDDMGGLYEVLERVIKRLNKGEGRDTKFSYSKELM
jgi:hypothetical protein